MENADILVVGDLNIDYLGKIPFFPAPDEEVAIDPLDGYLGGSGANFSVIAARLGLKVAFYSAVGNDPLGSSLIQMVEEEGVSIEHIKRVDGVASGLVFGAIDPDGVRRLFCYRGANLHLFPADIPTQAIASVQWLHLNGPEFTLASDLLKRSRELKIRTSMDPGSILIEEHIIDDLLPLTDVLFLNEVEFEKLTTGRNYIERAESLHRKGANWIALKHQAEGCVLFRKDHTPIIQNAFSITAVDSTGAGDAFNAGLVYGILNEFEINKSLKLANAVGALTAMSTGATSGVPKTYREVEDFIQHASFNSTALTLQ